MPTDLATWRRFMFQACLNSVIPWTLIAWGERFVDAGPATILNSAAPIFTFLFTALVTRHEPVTPRKLLGVVAGMAGICLIVGVDAFHGDRAGAARRRSRSSPRPSVTPAPRSSAAVSRASIRSRRLPARCWRVRPCSFP